jgi:hypothetical protein
MILGYIFGIALALAAYGVTRRFRPRVRLLISAVVLVATASAWTAYIVSVEDLPPPDAIPWEPGEGRPK